MLTFSSPLRAMLHPASRLYVLSHCLSGRVSLANDRPISAASPSSKRTYLESRALVSVFYLFAFITSLTTFRYPLMCITPKVLCDMRMR